MRSTGASRKARSKNGHPDAVQPVLVEQGQLGSARTFISYHPRASSSGHQVHEQLWPVSVPRKAHTAFVTNLLEGKKVPVYGTGKNVRDWIYVLDHCKAVDFVLHNGSPGEIYNIGGGAEKTNIEITDKIIELLGKDQSVIEHVKDRPGHDLRYSLDCSKLKNMGWKPEYSFDEALKNTVEWYVENRPWWEKLKHPAA